MESNPKGAYGLTVNFPTMPKVKNPHLASLIVNFVKYTVLAYADSPTFVQLPTQPYGAGWARVGSEREDGPVQSLEDRFGEGFELPGGSRIDQDAIVHNFPARCKRLRTTS